MRFLLCLALLFLPLRALGDRRLDLIFAADLGGRYTPERCEGPPEDAGAGLAALAGAIESAVSQSGRDRSLVIGGAGLVAPGNLPRYLLTPPRSTREHGSQALAHLLSQAGIEIFAPGGPEFAMAPEGLLGYFHELNRDQAVVVSNLGCMQDQALCRKLLHEFSRSRVVSRNGVRLGIVAVLSEDLAQRVGPGHLRGASVLPPKKSGLAGLVKALRPQVDVVVMVADLDKGLGAGGAIDVVRQLEAEDAHVDLVLLTRMDDRNAAAASLKLSNGTWLIGAPSEGRGVAVVSLHLPDDSRPQRGVPWEEEGQKVRPRWLPDPRTGVFPVPSIAVKAEVDRLHRQMCERWGRDIFPLSGKGLSRDVFTRLVLDAMRHVAGADLALINRKAIDEHGLPVYSISAAGVGSALPFPNRVVVADVPGQALGDALGKYAGQEPGAGLAMVSLSHDPDGGKKGPLLVNGRPLDPAIKYRVATIDFVAAGGDGLVPAELFQHSDVVRGDLRLAVLEYLQVRRTDLGLGRWPLVLNERPLWNSTLDLGLDLQSVTVNNPAGVTYDRSSLSRQAQVAVKLDATARVQMDLPQHLLQLSLRGQYGGIFLSPSQGGAADGPKKPTGGTPGWQESVDLINALALYSYRYTYRSKTGVLRGVRFVPMPTASLGLESEFNQPATRQYHHMELSALLGLRTAVGSKFSVLLGVGLRKELLARSYVPEETDVARTRLLLSVSLMLLKSSLWPRLGDRLLGECSLAYNFTDPEKLRSHEVRGGGKLYIALGRPLYITLGVDLYLYADQGRPPGVALDASAGLKVLLDARKQVF